MTEEKKIRPKTTREKKYIKYRAEGCKIGESALRSGYAHAEYGSYLEAQPHIQSALQTAMEKAGLSDNFIAQRLREGVDATDPEIKSAKGAVLKKASPNFFIRHKYIETVMKAKGSLAQEGAIVKNQQINIMVTSDVAKGFLDSGVITKKEHGDLKKYIEHEPIKEKSD